MRRALLLMLFLAVATNALAQQAPSLSFTFDGVHATNGFCETPSCQTTFATFALPEGAHEARLSLLWTHRAPIEFQSSFDIYLVAPSGVYAPLLHNGLAPANVHGCWPGDLECSFEGPTTSSLAAEPGEWRLTYRGVHYGALELGVFVS